MKLAIIGSRKITNVDIGLYIPNGVTEIVSRGARGVDTLAKEYAIRNDIKLTEFFPDSKTYQRAAPLKRNETVAEYADEALVFWDGCSKGTEYTVEIFRRLGKRITVILC